MAEEQKVKVSTITLEGNKSSISTQSPSQLRFIKAWWQISSSGNQFSSLYELLFFITALRWIMVSRGLI